MVICEWLYEPGTGDTDLKPGTDMTPICTKVVPNTISFFSIRKFYPIHFLYPEIDAFSPFLQVP